MYKVLDNLHQTAAAYYAVSKALHHLARQESLTCMSQSFSGAFPGMSTSPIQSTCTMWNVSQPMMALTHAKGDSEPPSCPSSFLGPSGSASGLEPASGPDPVGLPDAAPSGPCWTAGLTASPAAADDVAVSPLLTGGCCRFFASCFCFVAFSCMHDQVP